MSIALLFCCLLVCVVDAEVRGVNKQDQVLFQAAYEQGQFTCKSGKITIPYSRVNDDYCDCDDGSDEPGTSACLSSRFFCLNRGFKSKSVFSSRVNDGVCDCCDGSDEWNRKTPCANTCQVDGVQYRRDLKDTFQKIKQALIKKDSLLNEASKMQQRRESDIQSLNERLREAEADIQRKTLLKQEKEREEEKVRLEKQIAWKKEQEAKKAQLKAEHEERQKQQQQNQQPTQESSVTDSSTDEAQQPTLESSATATTTTNEDNNNNDDDNETNDNNDFDKSKNGMVEVEVDVLGQTHTHTHQQQSQSQSQSQSQETEQQQQDIVAGAAENSRTHDDAWDGVQNVPDDEYFDDDHTYMYQQQSEMQPHTIQNDLDEHLTSRIDVDTTNAMNNPCIGWIQTSGCNPKGARESSNDRSCDVIVPKGASGYCECSAELRYDFTCSHGPLICRNVCKGILPPDEPEADYHHHVPESNIPPAKNTELHLEDSESESEGWVGWLLSPFRTVAKVFGLVSDDDKKPNIPQFTTKEADEARKALEDAKSAKSVLESRLSDLNRDTTLNFGENNVFYPLKGKCADITLNKYRYEVCLFGNTQQHEGGSMTSLGSYDSLARDSEGVYRISYKGGQRCWGGPDRSAVVEMRCGPEFRILSVNEAEKCVYHMIAEIPAGCSAESIKNIENELRELESPA